MTDEAIDPTASTYEVAKCPLPDCGEDLYIIWTASSALYLSFKTSDLATPEPQTTCWEISCEMGHTVMVPIDNAEDTFEFGRCKCEPTDMQDDDWCEHADMKRLRKLLSITLTQVSTDAFQLRESDEED